MLAMVVALLEYFIHKRIRASLKKKRRDKKVSYYRLLLSSAEMF